MTATSDGQVVPTEAVERLQVCDTDAHLHDRAESCVRAIATPLLAAELRRLQELARGDPAAVPHALERRLAELDADMR